jgi:tetratricopeptide (TPR) repeat protein
MMAGFQNTGFRICGYVVLLVCAVWQIFFSFQEQQSLNEKIDKSEAVQERNVRGLTYLAKEKYMLEADLDTAMSLLQQALTVNPSYVPAWLILAELNNDLGQKEKAYAILYYIDLLTAGLKRWRWDKALTAYQLGKIEMLPGELSYIVQEIDGKNRNDALKLAFTLWDEPKELLEKMKLDNITHLFGYAIRHNISKKALFFWETMEKEGVQWQQKEALIFLDVLIQADELKVASDIWRKNFNPDEILFNGDFSQPFLDRAFGWRIGKKKNFDQNFEESSNGSPSRTVHYRFKGWDNLNFTHLAQIVPIKGGKEYRLRAEMKSQKMTTDQRPFVEVSGFKCEMLAASSEMVAADQDWTEHQVVVQVPEECAAIVVRLRRKESKHIDNKLAGQLWARNFVISVMGKDSRTIDASKQ